MDDAAPAASGDGSQGVPQHLRPQDHAGPPTEGRVVDMTKGVPGVRAVAMGMQPVPQIAEGATRDAQVGGLEEFREEREGVESHHFTSTWKAAMEARTMRSKLKAK